MEAEWTPVATLIDRIATDDDLLRGVVTSVRALVRESAALTTEDIVGHTRALIFAATRALADRRGPSEAELSFVEDFAETRAKQGVPLEAVLGAVHVSERTIWTRARELAPASGVSSELLFDVRELYDDWAESVRSRLVVAHRAAAATANPVAHDRDASILRRLFEGGTAATLAATEAGLPIDRQLWVIVGHGADAPHWHAALRAASGRHVAARLGGWFAAVVSSPPGALPVAGSADVGPVAGYAGPVTPDGLGPARRLAESALPAAQNRGCSGLVHVAEVASLVALGDRPDLAAMLVDHRAAEWRELGTSARPVAEAVVAWLECDRDVGAAAERLFVHPNTVRNRVQRFVDVTGINERSVLGAADAWWLCTTWLAL
ncbi:MAG: helix-turn-helix domain-containing protein [Salinibacterium sp.]|nr:helix-turn-helix domain-containing protein [Salinibacterium sp.]MBF0671803.1 helix-turn-helix domain-containing protein [Salinibacterium sp.]